MSCEEKKPRKTYEKLELTLKDLSRLALGVPELGQVNFVILQSLIEMLMRKLNCEDEKVYISGLEANCLEKILVDAKTSPLAFDDKKVEVITEKLNRLEDLEKQVDYVDSKLEKHFEEIRKATKVKEVDFSTSFWHVYAENCEDLCTTCDPDNLIACQLLNNVDFCKKLMRRITDPVIKRILEFEKKVVLLSEELHTFMERAKQEYLKIALVEHCIFDIGEVRTRLELHQAKFLATMEEIQDMLDSKLDKVHIPALKKYIKDRFDQIDATIKKMKEKKACPRAAGLIMNGLTCLSCGNTKICAEPDVNATAALPNWTTRKVEKLSKKYCGCSPTPTEPKLTERIAKIDVTSRPKPHRVSSVQSIKSRRSSRCSVSLKGSNFQLLTGVDGQQYRAEH